MVIQEFLAQLPDPDHVGQSEYRALHDLLTTSLDDLREDPEEDSAELMESMLENLEGWIGYVRRDAESKGVS